MSDLERRYLRLVRIFYPAGYRNERGTEIVGTYLALSSPDQRWPSAADVTDLAGGGLRQRLREVGATGIGPGLRLAAPLALLTATALAGGWTVLELNPWTTPWFGFEQHGMSASLGVGVWAAWLLAAVVHVVAPGRWTRLAIGSALVLTLAVGPLAAVVGRSRPPLFVLLAQASLGLVALGVPARLPVWLRLLPLAGAAAALPVAATFAHDSGEALSVSYGWPAGQVLPGAGTALLLVTLLAGMGPAARNDLRGAWALLVLLYPIGMLWLHPLAEELAVGLYGGGPNADWTTLATAAIAVSAAAPVIVVPAALIARRRVVRAYGRAERDAVCGSLTRDSTKR
ncbi:hypothetical protein [Actinoplanes teichomyceticus]|uniref:Uncharacterized protein n=1 Tax=Actinoplanes teichomyceticus TaxID=1867 RepID=A0A561VCI3_ACTTI|nr:hypothetical protein [Actinoplanes teichomyceticus]TWG09325.1 hypothetical protein FHX34_10840 [Actinoplanes teichomyceticus]GIF16651.1 hypothetical protein Ate01nite_66830 [Actinoplanes teichomyceticus]